MGFNSGFKGLTGKDVEERSQYYLGIAWRDWEKSRRICGKCSQSLLERIPGTWILDEEPDRTAIIWVGIWTRDQDSRKLECSTNHVTVRLCEMVKYKDLHVPHKSFRYKKGHNFIKVKTINKRNTLKHKTESSELWGEETVVMAAKSKVAHAFPLVYIHWRIQQWGHSPTTPQLQNDNNDNGPMGCVQEMESGRELLFEKSRESFDMWLCIRMYDETQNTYSSDVHVKFRTHSCRNVTVSL
jgi:hypothetical protein